MGSRLLLEADGILSWVRYKKSTSKNENGHGHRDGEIHTIAEKVKGASLLIKHSCSLGAHDVSPMT